jgi:hypothetical protein
MSRLYRKHLGPSFSEGTRQLWIELIKLGRGRENWGITAAAAELSNPKKGIRLSKVGLLKILYGDRNPGATPAEIFRKRLKIDPELFRAKPNEDFVPPDSLDPANDVAPLSAA